MPLLDNPPELDAWRQRLFRVEEPIHLTREQFRVYWPHVDNVWALQQRRDAANFKRVMYRCRLAKKPNPPQKDPTKKMRNRARREKQCDSGLTMYQYPDGTTVLKRNQHPHAHDLEKSDEIKRNSVRRTQLAKVRAAKHAGRKLDKGSGRNHGQPGEEDSDGDETADDTLGNGVMDFVPPGYLEDFSSSPDDAAFTFGKMYAVVMLDMTGDIGDSIRASEEGEKWMKKSAQWISAVHAQEPRPLCIFSHLIETSSQDQSSLGFAPAPTSYHPLSHPNNQAVPLHVGGTRHNAPGIAAISAGPPQSPSMLNGGPPSNTMQAGTPIQFPSAHIIPNGMPNQTSAHGTDSAFSQSQVQHQHRFVTQRIPAQQARQTQQQNQNHNLQHGHPILQSQLPQVPTIGSTHHQPIQPRPEHQFQSPYVAQQGATPPDHTIPSFQVTSPTAKLPAVQSSLGARSLGTERPVTHMYENFVPKTGYDVAIVRNSQFSGTGYELEPTLRDNQVDTVIISGLRTAGLVLNTVVHLLNLNYKIYVISDACIETGDNAYVVDQATKQYILPSLPVHVITLSQAMQALNRSGPVAYKPAGAT